MSSSMGADISHPQDRLLSTIYPVKPPSKQRTDRRMQVLALGLSRSGTDSLRQALVMLGYRGVYHGWEVSGGSPEDVAFWVPWLKRKFVKGGYDCTSFLPDLTAAKFDTVLGDREATTDAPANMFGEELMLAYPDAKVVLNRRQIDPWYRSMQGTAIGVFSPLLWWCGWFDGTLYWLWRTYHLSLIDWARGDFGRYGKEAYLAHYEKLEELCQRHGKEYLNWSVEDGWGPLCEFLGKPMPEEPFPHGNAAGQQFNANVERVLGNHVKNALARSAVIVTAAAAVGVALAFRLRRS